MPATAGASLGTPLEYRLPGKHSANHKPVVQLLSKNAPSTQQEEVEAFTKMQSSARNCGLLSPDQPMLTLLEERYAKFTPGRLVGKAREQVVENLPLYCVCTFRHLSILSALSAKD